MSYKSNATPFVPPVKPGSRRIYSNDDVKDLFNRFLNLPDLEKDSSIEADRLNEEFIEDLETFKDSIGARKAKSLLRSAGASREDLTLMF